MIHFTLLLANRTVIGLSTTYCCLFVFFLLILTHTGKNIGVEYIVPGIATKRLRPEIRILLISKIYSTIALRNKITPRDIFAISYELSTSINFILFRYLKVIFKRIPCSEALT